MSKAFFVTGIGTGVGKTVISAILCKALNADYWKPVQCGLENGTDTEFISHIMKNTCTHVYEETYRLTMPASPHIAAREAGIRIDTLKIIEFYRRAVDHEKSLIIEGAGGLMVPLNEKEFVIDLIKMLDIPVIIVSRNYLGSINHSLISAVVVKNYGLKPGGWIFNDQYLSYEEEIIQWSGLPRIASIPSFKQEDTFQFIEKEAEKLRPILKQLL